MFEILRGSVKQSLSTFLHFCDKITINIYGIFFL